jgi:hypothetical protein
LKTPEDEAFEEIERIQRTRTRWVPVEKPQRTWVGLTNREFEEVTHGMEDLEDCWIAIEDALRKKNNV